MELQGIPVISRLHEPGFASDEESGVNCKAAAGSSPQISNNASESLMRCCEQNKTVLLFLRSTGNYWSDSMVSFDLAFFLLSMCVNAGSVVTNFTYMWLVLFVFSYPSSALQFASAGVDFAIVIRTLSVLPAQYMNHQRLHRLADNHDVMVLDESARIAVIFGLLSTGTTFIATVLMALGTEPIYAASFITEFFLSAVLTFNMFFLILDIRASSVILDELHLLADNKQLTMDKFASSREKIHNKVKDSLWASDFIIVPCLASIAAILVLILFFLDRTNRTAVQYETCAFIAYMLKELFFVAVAFWYVAKVNARADELTVKVSKSLWGKYNSHQPGYNDTIHGSNSNSLACDGTNTELDEEEGKSDTSSLLVNTVQMSDLHRVSIYASSMSEPISFTLLFKRVSWQNVAVSAAGICTTVVIALIRSIIIL